MRRIAATALGVALISGAVAMGQEAATLGRPVSASPRVRAQMAETPVMTVPDPATLLTPVRGAQVATPVAFSPALPNTYAAPTNPPFWNASSQSPANYAPPNYGYPTANYGYPPPNYGYPPPNYGYPPNNGYAPTETQNSTFNAALKGDAVRRTSFSSRTAVSRFGEDVGGQVNDCCEWIKGCFTSDGRTLFESDHCLDVFASPVSNPFLFQDPRSLTQIKPLFIYQQIPSSNTVLQGGSIFYYGFTASVALTDRWSFTLNKLGGISINPDNTAQVADGAGLAEIWLGTQFTFVRNAQSGTAVAAGLIFQIPAGPSKVFQDTGDFSMVPYLSFAQSFGRSSYGAFQLMDTFGFAFEVGSGRSDYFYNSMGLGFDIANVHKYYPMLEFHWFHYTSSGNTRPTDQEGTDLANVGATGVSGTDYLTLTPAFRWKFNENAQFGIGTEFPVSSPKGFEQFRLVVDFIIRY